MRFAHDGICQVPRSPLEMLSWSFCHLCRLLLALHSTNGAARKGPPTVQLDQATFVGTTDGVTTQFLGIPYAKPPIGDLRFNLPVAVDPYAGSHTASAFGPACPQQAIEFPHFFGVPATTVDFIVNRMYKVVTPAAEDCLSINVVVPEGTDPSANLPVVVWIFGGGFVVGGTETYDGGVIVERSIDIGKPIIYVSMNYRVSAYGFLASKEVKNAGVGNLGLQDQRLALRWVQKYISAFGGDPTKVTIWGESAGAMSVALHMLTNSGNTDGLFRGAFMQSGAPIPVGDITHGQAHYDALVAQTKCSVAKDTLHCLRHVPFETLQTAVDKSPGIFSYQSLRLAWVPRADGLFLPDAPQQLVEQGNVAKVPFVSGNCDDEGTMFSFSTLNITTDKEFREYMVSNYVPDLHPDDPRLERLFGTLYPADITKGSPFNTGVFNAITPQYKRFAAIQGDLVFQAPRRFFLQHRADKQPTWSFLHKRGKVTPVMGATHGTDIANIYDGGELTDYLINFVTHLDPNGDSGTNTYWPKYTPSSPKMLTLLDDLFSPLTITNDNYRVDGIKLLSELSLEFPL
ncbi:carotenoid ester lipase precursor [Earliella scabrosa]|nr:carotenoid ester lipase precursor [Earliella scabrosa]